MSTPFIAQIMGFGGNFAPRGWALCNGQLLAINTNQALFSILGTTYGGNGQTTFALPDLRGRSAVHWGQGPGLSNISLGQQGGTETATLTAANMPSHNHTASFDGSSSQMKASTTKATTQAPQEGSALGRAVDNTATVQPFIYAPPGSPTAVSLSGLNVAGSVATGVTGGSQPFSIRSPYTAISMIIALEGIFPSRN